MSLSSLTISSHHRASISALRHRHWAAPGPPSPDRFSSSVHFPTPVGAKLHGPSRKGLCRCILGSGGGAIAQDAVATTAVLAGAYSLVLAFDTLTQRNLIQQSLSRKLVHIFSGLLFMVSWPIFRELLRGPLYYVLILILCAIVYWRESPTGVISLAMMCGGDGIADIIGRRFGSQKLPYNRKKSWAGSISMFVCGCVISVWMLHYFSSLGYFQLDWAMTLQRVALISLVATVVESLPITEVLDDNISVPLSSMLMAFWSFGY